MSNSKDCKICQSDPHLCSSIHDGQIQPSNNSGLSYDDVYGNSDSALKKVFDNLGFAVVRNSEVHKSTALIITDSEFNKIEKAIKANYLPRVEVSKALEAESWSIHSGTVNMNDETNQHIRARNQLKAELKKELGI